MPNNKLYEQLVSYKFEYTEIPYLQHYYVKWLLLSLQQKMLDVTDNIMRLDLLQVQDIRFVLVNMLNTDNDAVRPMTFNYTGAVVSSTDEPIIDKYVYVLTAHSIDRTTSTLVALYSYQKNDTKMLQSGYLDTGFYVLTTLTSSSDKINVYMQGTLIGTYNNVLLFVVPDNISGLVQIELPEHSKLQLTKYQLLSIDNALKIKNIYGKGNVVFSLKSALNIQYLLFDNGQQKSAVIPRRTTDGYVYEFALLFDNEQHEYVLQSNLVYNNDNLWDILNNLIFYHSRTL